MNTPVRPKVANSWNDISTHFEGSVNYLDTEDVENSGNFAALTKKNEKDQPGAV